MKMLKENVRFQVRNICEGVIEELNIWQRFVYDAWPLLFLLLAALGVAVWLAKPAPPKLVLMATGSADSYYNTMATKYVEFFRKNGVTLELFTTHGAQENLARLKDRKDRVQAAFVQSGTVEPGNTAGLLSLGSINYEPIWFFYRERGDMKHDEDMRHVPNLKIAIGPEGSGTRTQALRVLGINGAAPTATLLTMSKSESVLALRRGEIDAAFVVESFEAADVQALLKDPGIGVANFRRAAAYSRLLPFIEKLEVPTGGFDLVRNFPSQDLQLIATTTNLLIDDRMHPAIQMLFMQAAREINGKETYFAARGEFPSFKDPIVPESKEAVRFLQKGPPFLMNYLPFWLAEFIDRMFLLLLPLFAFAYPVVRVIPGYRFNRLKTRINNVYGELKFFEQELSQACDPARHDEYIRRINAIERKALVMRLPKDLAANYYSLRKDIDFVRNRLSPENPYGQIEETEGAEKDSE